jgi:Family of unknown function (DUF5990)
LEREATLRIVLESPPEGVDFALQKGRGSNYEIVQKQRSTNKDLKFEFSVRAKSPGVNAPPNFLGPFVQGPPGDRFVYIDIGTFAGQTDSCWSRRLKVPLSAISWDMIEEPGLLEARVPGTGSDGGPSCATVKSFAGWKLKR